MCLLHLEVTRIFHYTECPSLTIKEHCKTKMAMLYALRFEKQQGFSLSVVEKLLRDNGVGEGRVKVCISFEFSLEFVVYYVF